MFSSQVFESALSITMFVLRILVPLLSTVVLVRCFVSLKRGRRKEEPVVLLEDLASGLSIPVLYWENSIGRSKSCDIVLPDSTCSRDHAVLYRRASGWMITDTNSKAGTYVNDKKIKEANKLVKSKDKSLDENLKPALETVISETKASKYKIIDIPDKESKIEKETKKMNNYNFEEVKGKLQEAYNNLDTSIKQYKLVNHPNETYVIQCLQNVPNVKDISAVTEDNDPNGQLNKAGGYTAQVCFSSDLIDQSSIDGNTVIEKGTDCGGSIEVYKTEEEANKRNDYLGAFDGGIFASGSHTVYGTKIIRTSDKLTASQQKQLENDILNSLTTIK